MGHPLLDRARDLPSNCGAQIARTFRPDDPALALFPGSRQQEIDRHLDHFVATARLLEASMPGLQVVVSVASTVTIDPLSCPYKRVESDSFTVLRAADAALCKAGRPPSRRRSPDVRSWWVPHRYLSYLLARAMVTIPHIGLVNVVAGREVAREFVQDALKPDDVAAALTPLFQTSSPERTRVLEGLAEVRGRLGTPGAAARVAAMASELVP